MIVERGAVHIWAIDLGDAARADAGRPPAALESLDAVERARAGRFRADADWQRYVIAHTALRTLLGDYLAIEPGEVRYERGPYGKPRADGISFTLSHAGDLAVAAFAADREVGIDVEALRTVRDLERVATRFFTSRESAALAATASAERDAAFLACWTRKEAVVKALGLGLSVPLDSFEVSLPGDGPARVLDASGAVGPAASWALTHLAFGAGYTGALAVRGAAPSVSRRAFVGASPPGL